jgi:hypothetical protein
MPLLERTRLAPVMSPAEIDLLLLDLRSELTAEAETAELAQYHALLEAFRRDWRQVYALHGESAAGWPQYAALRRELRATSRELGAGLSMRTNRIEAHRVLEGRVLRAALPAVPADGTGAGVAASARPASGPITARPQRPVFIVSAPRSGSTLLFETLASSRHLYTLGGEAHWLVEDLEALRPGAPGVESNRLTAEHATDEHAQHILQTIATRLRDADRASVPFRPELRLLEKTPKNALRIPFFERIFPDALYVFLWRDPRENLSSIMEAWRSGRWKTYNGLDGFDGPWSLLLPPEWRRLNGRPLAEIAAFQWEAANRIALDDLAGVPRERWTVLRYADLIADAPAAIGRLCAFIGIEMDTQLRTRVSHPLPLSRFTQTPPDPDKWRRNAAEIERVLPAVTPIWRRLQELGS